MAKDLTTLKRLEIPFFEGVNTQVSDHLAKKQELRYAENARSKIIGILEKREGTRRLGNALVSSANLGLFNFPNTTGTSIYRISTVSGTTRLYYLNNSAAWTALTGNGTGLTAAQHDTTLAESNAFLVNGTDANFYIGPNGTAVYTSADLGSSTTQFDVTNPAGDTHRYTFDGTGTDPAITTNINAGDIVHITGSNLTAANRGSFTVNAVDTDYFEVTNASGVVESNKTLGTGVLRVSNHLTNSPVATRIKFYKDRLYLGNYKVGSTQYKTGIMFSSKPLGIAALVDGDHDQPVTALKVTDTKYIYSDDVLDVYRGGTLIGTIIVTAKDSTTNTLTIDSFTTNIKSSDELWVAGTYTGKRIFRWVENPQSGENVKQFDTFKTSGDPDNAITMLEDVGDVLMIGNNNSLASWNDYSLTEHNMGIGCASKQGYIKNIGTLFFVHYSGVYATVGGLPKLISSKVEEYFTGATKAGIEACAAGKKGKSVFFAIGTVILYNPDGTTKKTLSNVVLEYDLRKENWYVHTGIPADQFATYIASSDPDRLQFTNTTGNFEVHEFLLDPSLNSGLFDDDDVEIPFVAGTPNLYLSKNFEQSFYPRYIIIESDAGNDIKVFISLNGKPEYQIKETARKGVSLLRITPRTEDEREAKCRTIAITLKEYSKRRCRIKRVTLLYEDAKEDPSNNR